MSSSSLLQIIVVAGALVGLEACTGLPVKTDINPNMSVANCHTYAFADEHMANADHGSAFGNPLNSERLRQAIEANMAAKGIQKVDDRRSAECVVGYAMGTRQVFDDFYGPYGAGWGWGGGWGRRGWGWGGGFYDGPYVYDETRIAVDVFDAKSRIPIWHASVSQTVSDLTGPHAVEKINAAAAAIFAKFPVGGGMPPAGSHAAT
ncbi:MAG: DUF4136 domain-containing protein [Steroidobacteraceae bacterium]